MRRRSSSRRGRDARANRAGRALLLSLLFGCLGREPQPAAITAPQIIAILADPPEVEPGTTAHYQAIVASPGAVEPQLTWSYCTTARALRDHSAVAPSCAEMPELPIAGSGARVDATVPADACARFGPAVPAGQRPVDPDPSGGYYQPVRAQLPGGQIAILRHRLRCPLADAPLPIAQEFAGSYRPNTAPAIAAFTLAQGALELDPANVPAAAELTLRVALSPDAAERYLVYDAARGQLEERDEQLEVSWYASAGVLSARTTPAEAQSSEVAWRAPEQAGPARLWLVVRDDRGGAGARTVELSIQTPAPQ